VKLRLTALESVHQRAHVWSPNPIGLWREGRQAAAEGATSGRTYPLPGYRR
jgi:hypothetical protein